MKDRGCPQEDAVSLASRTGQWSESLRDHVSQCDPCARVELVSRWMGGVAETLGAGSRLPDPGLLWLKAQVAEQQRLEEQALRPVMWARTFVHFGLWVALSLGAFWLWPSVNALMDGLGTWLRVPSRGVLLSIEPGRLVSALTLLAVASGCLYLHRRFQGVFHR